MVEATGRPRGSLRPGLKHLGVGGRFRHTHFQFWRQARVIRTGGRGGREAAVEFRRLDHRAGPQRRERGVVSHQEERVDSQLAAEVVESERVERAANRQALRASRAGGSHTERPGGELTCAHLAHPGYECVRVPGLQHLPIPRGGFPRALPRPEAEEVVELVCARVGSDDGHLQPPAALDGRRLASLLVPIVKL